MKSVLLAEAAKNLDSLCEDVCVTHERVAIVRKGNPSAVLISLSELESLEETVAILSDEDAMVAITEALTDVADGNVIPADLINLRPSH